LKEWGRGHSISSLTSTLNAVSSTYILFAPCTSNSPLSISYSTNLCTFSCGPLNDAFSISIYSARWWDEWWMVKTLEGSSHDLNTVLSQHSPEGTKQHHKNLSEDTWWHSCDLHWAPSTYVKPKVLPLDQPVQFHIW
jgi:hypothetical protein